MQHDQMQSLMGAYALDAVEPSEDAAVQRHLAGCPACRREVADLQEVAALLAIVVGPAPARLWDGIASEMSEYPDGSIARPIGALPAPVKSGDEHPGTRHAVSFRIFAAVVALAAVFIAALGLQLGHLNDRPHRTAWQAAVASPDARKVTLVSSDGSRSAMAVVEDDGTSYLGPNNLPALASGRSYQLWGKVGANMVSLAVLRTAAPYQKFSTPAPTEALVITNEPASGVISSRQPAVVSSVVPTRQ